MLEVSSSVLLLAQRLWKAEIGDCVYPSPCHIIAIFCTIASHLELFAGGTDRGMEPVIPRAHTRIFLPSKIAHRGTHLSLQIFVSDARAALCGACPQ